MKLERRCALITGGSQGLGKSIARSFLREGASVMICARDAKALEATARELSVGLQKGQQIFFKSADISDEKEARALIVATLEKFPRLDVLVNNAGIYGPKGNLETTDWAEWVNAIRINLFGAVFLCRELLPHFKVLGRGKIINLSGGGATAPFPRFSAYATSKAAIVRFTETLAEEIREQHIDVNAIAPGPLNTRFTDEVLEAGPDRVGREFYEKARIQKTQGGAPMEKASELCVFLASAASDGITGKLLSALWDPWADLDGHKDELRRTDIYTLRRIVPEDRGKKWEGSGR